MKLEELKAIVARGDAHSYEYGEVAKLMLPKLIAVAERALDAITDGYWLDPDKHLHPCFVPIMDGNSRQRLYEALNAVEK